MLIWYDVEAWRRIGQSDKNKSKKKPSALWTRGTVEKCLKKKDWLSITSLNITFQEALKCQGKFNFQEWNADFS